MFVPPSPTELVEEDSSIGRPSFVPPSPESLIEEQPRELVTRADTDAMTRPVPMTPAATPDAQAQSERFYKRQFEMAKPAKEETATGIVPAAGKAGELISKSAAETSASWNTAISAGARTAGDIAAWLSSKINPDADHEAVRYALGGGLADFTAGAADLARKSAKEVTALSKTTKGPQAVMQAEGVPKLAELVSLGPYAPFAIGVEVFGDTYQRATEAYQQSNPEWSPQDLHAHAMIAAAPSGLVSGLTWWATQFAGPKAIGKDLLTDSARSELAQFIPTYLKHIGITATAAEVDALQQGLIAKATYNPNMPVEDIFRDAVSSGKSMAALAAILGAPKIAALAGRDLLTRQTVREYSPEQIKDTFARVTSDWKAREAARAAGQPPPEPTSNPQEEELIRGIGDLLMGNRGREVAAGIKEKGVRAVTREPRTRNETLLRLFSLSPQDFYRTVSAELVEPRKGAKDAIDTVVEPGGVRVERPRIDEVGQAPAEAGVGNRLPGPAGQPPEAAPAFTPPTPVVTPESAPVLKAQDIAKEIGFTYEPAMEAMVPGRWHFTDQRKDSPTAGMSFTIPQGATALEAHAAILDQIAKGFTPPSAATAKGGEKHGKEEKGQEGQVQGHGLAPAAKEAVTAPPAKPMAVISKGDWIEYTDDYGKTHQGKVDEIWTKAHIVPTRSGVQTRKIRHEYSIVDAQGKAMVSPKEGTPVTKIAAPEPTPAKSETKAPEGGTKAATDENLAALTDKEFDELLNQATEEAAPTPAPAPKPKSAIASQPKAKGERPRSIRTEKPAESRMIAGIRDEIKKLKQGLPVAEDMAMNDKGASLDRLEKKIAEAQARLDAALAAAALQSGRGGVIPSQPKEHLTDAAKAMKKALDEAAKGLDELFGGGQRMGTGPSFDEETYRKAKPHFDKAWEETKKSGGSLLDFLKAIIKRWGEAIKPYLQRWRKDLQAATKGETDESTRRPLVPEPVDVAEGQPTGPVPGTGAPPEGTAVGGGSGSAVGKPNAPSDVGAGGKPGSRRGGRAGATVSSGGTAGGTTPGERPGVEQGPHTDEVFAGPDRFPEENLRIQPGDPLAPTSRGDRIKANLKAIALSKKIAAENRLATPAEKRIIMQFSGWGDTFQVFGMTPIRQGLTADDVYQLEKGGRQVYNLLYRPDERERYEKWKKQYAAAYDSLKESTTPEEWESFKGSSLNAHYTNRAGIQALWAIAQRLGWNGGIAVETSAGIGSVIGLTPDALASKVHWIGVELDALTAQMLKQLYPRSDIQNVGFEKSSRTQNNSANLVITNFPFGDYPIVDTNHPDYDGWSVHNYFLARSIDTVKPGGLVVAITSHHTLDAAGGKPMRDWLSSRADMIGAIRMPNTAFKESAGTEVVTDILIFRKKDGINSQHGERFASLAKVEIPAENRATKRKDGESDEAFAARMAKPVLVNEYFVEHPEMVLGAHSTKGTMYAGDTYTVMPRADVPLQVQLMQAMMNLPENIVDSEKEAEAAAEAAEVKTIEGQKEGRYVVEEGKIYQVDDQGRMIEQSFPAAQAGAVKKLIAVRHAVTKQIEIELDENATDEAIEAARKELNRLYDAFVESRGALNDRKNDLIDDDPEWPLMAQLEDEQRKPIEIDVRGKKVTRYIVNYVKGPMLLRRVNFPHVEPTKADNLADAVSISINMRGAINPEFIGKLVGMDPEEARQKVIEEQLAFENPASGLLEPPDLYLSGFVKVKLAEAQRAAQQDAKYARNVEALTKVQPAPLPAEKIYFRLGSNWLSSDQIQRFLLDVLEIDSTVQFIRAEDATQWIVGDPRRNSTANNQTYSAGGVPGHELVMDSLNLKLTEVTTQVEDENGNKKTVKLPKETAAARDMQDRIQAAFRDWVLKHPEEAQGVQDTYNQLFNGLVRREYQAPRVDYFPGASHDVQLRSWQKRGAVRAVQEGTLFAHTVGTGKTYTIITTAMEMRRLGVAKKPMVVVQNSTLTQFANSFRRLYPAAQMLVGNAKQTDAKRRKQFVAKMATREWDAIIIPVSFFERIENDADREASYVQEQLENLEAMIREAEGRDYSPDKRPKSALGKQLQRVKRRFEARMERILERLKKKADDLITFEQLGVDALIVDEAHHFKRGDFQTKMDRVKGLDTNGSDRSMDFLLKTQWIHQKSPDKNVILATGTPISNTLAEMWTMMRYIKPGLLKQFGVDTFDDFVGTFATTKATIEETPTGGFAQVLRLARYVNGPELGQFWRSGADVYVLNRDDFKSLGMDVPEVKGGGPREIVIPRSEAVTKFVEFIRDWRLWSENLDGQQKAELSYVPILQYGLARKAAIDLRLVNPNLPDDPGSKVNRVVQEVFNLWRETTDINGTQLIFSNLYQSHDPKQRWLNEDLHLPNPLYGQATFNLFDDFKRKLVKLGIPESEIANFSTMDEKQRFAAAEQVKAGRIRIALGTTETLGTGLNLQDHIVAINHVDPQFRPMDFEQRNGRGIRQGNQNKEVELNVFGVKNTMDSSLYELMLIKSKFVAQAMTADNLSREFEDPADESTISFQAMAAAFSGNPLYAQRFALENDVRRLSILEEDYSRKLSEARSSLLTVQRGRDSFEKDVAVLLKSKAAMDAAFGDHKITKVEVKGVTSAGEEAKKALDALFQEPIAEMENNLAAEFASGDLARTHDENIKKLKRGVYVPDINRERTRKATINGIPFEIHFTATASMSALANGELQIISRQGRWKIVSDLRIADWSDESPWYSSQADIYGHAVTGGAFQSSLWNAVEKFLEREPRIEPARKRFGKMADDLGKEMQKPFEFGNRLKEQAEKLAAVLKELEASGFTTGQQQPPKISDIQAKYPQFAYLTRQVAAEGSADVIAQIQKEENARAKNSYYRLMGDGKYAIAKGATPIKLPGFEWIEAFVSTNKEDGVVSISDSMSGIRIGFGKSTDEARANALQKLSEAGEAKVRKFLQASSIKHGLSPRAKACDVDQATAFDKFQVGKLVTFDWDGTTYTGPIKAMAGDQAQAAVEVESGRQIIVPLRFVTLLTPAQQKAYEAEQAKLAAEAAPPDTTQYSAGLTGGETNPNIEELINEKHAIAETQVRQNPDGGRWLDDLRGAAREILSRVLQGDRVEPGTDRFGAAKVADGFYTTSEGGRLAALGRAAGAKVVFFTTPKENAPSGATTTIDGVKSVLINVSKPAVERVAVFEHELSHVRFRTSPQLRQLAALVSMSSETAQEYRNRYSDYFKVTMGDDWVREEIVGDYVSGAGQFAAVQPEAAFANGVEAYRLAREYHAQPFGDVSGEPPAEIRYSAGTDESGIEAAGGDKVQVAGVEYDILGKEKITREQKEQADARAAGLMSSLGFAGVADPEPDGDVFVLENDGQNHDAAAIQLRQEIIEQIQTQFQPGGNPAYVSSLVNAVNRNLPKGRWYGVVSRNVLNDLTTVTIAESSFRGQLLRAITGVKEDDVVSAGNNADIFLRRTYAKEFGGEHIEKAVRGALDTFKGELTDAEIEAALQKSEKFRDMLEKLTGGKALEFLKRVFVLPFQDRAELRANVEKLAAETLQVTPEAAKPLGKEFEGTFDGLFDRAAVRALEVLETAMSRADRQALGVGKPRSAWKVIERAVKAGRFDVNWVLQRIAESARWNVPTESELAVVRALAEEITSLRGLPLEKVKALKGNKVELARAKVLQEAATAERRVGLKRRIETYWSRWTRPVNLKTRKGWANAVEAGYEFTAANLLFKGGFLTRQSLDVLTSAIFHVPNRAFAHAITQHGGFVSNVANPEFWRDADAIIRLSAKTQIEALPSALREFKEALKGTAEIKNVDRLLSGIALFERVQLRADELAAKGDTARAFVLRLFGAIRFSYRFASAMDNLQGVPQEWQEIKTQAYRWFRESGLNLAEAKLRADEIVPDLRAEYIAALPKAREILEETGKPPTQSEVEAGAWHIVKGMAYQRMKEAEMPSDDYENRNRLMRSTNAWNESMAGVASIGGAVSGFMKAVGGVGKNFSPVALFTGAFGRFGNAIGIGIDRSLTWGGLGLFPSAFGAGKNYVDPETGIAARGSPFYRTAEDRAQRRIEGSIGLALGAIVAMLVLARYLVVRNKWPKDKEERELWDRMGWKPGTVALQLGDGKEIPLSMTVGPMAMVRPWLAGSGALVDALDTKAKAQEKLNAIAARKGLPPGQVKPLDAADMLAIAGTAAWSAALGGRTAGGLIGSLTDYGIPNANKTASALVSPFLPGLPAIQEASRLAGVQLDKTATFLDFLVPLPTSAAAKVNLLGDPAGNPNDLQRIVQILTGGTYPGVTDAQAAKDVAGYSALFSTGYRPPSIDAAKGYAFADGYRSMTDSELGKYTQLRGQYFKEALVALGDKPTLQQVQAAYGTANNRALSEVGIRLESPKTGQFAAPMTVPVAQTTRPASIRPPAVRSLARGRRFGRGRSLRASIGRTRLRPSRALRLPIRSSRRPRSIRTIRMA